MQIFKKYFFVLAFFAADSALGLPKLLPVDNGELTLGSTQDSSSRLYQDASDPDIFYITPKRVIPVNDPLTGKMLFKFSYSPEKNEGEFMAVLKIGFGIEHIQKQWKHIKSVNPQAKLRFLPIYNGFFGLALKNSAFTLLIGKGEVVHTDIAAGTFPVHIAINKNGLKVLRAQTQIGNVSVMTLHFEYKTRYIAEGERVQIIVNPRELIDALLAPHPAIKNEWEKSEHLSSNGFYKFLMLTYASNLWHTSGAFEATFNPSLAANILAVELDKYFKETYHADFDIKNKQHALNMDRAKLADQQVCFWGSAPGSIQELSDSAAMVMMGLCEHYQNNIYIEETGEAKCFEFPPMTLQNDPANHSISNGIWIPNF